MTVHDDKISSKRRRLFKALSVAPVVATLRPGSALATASAYQCLDNGHDISNWHQYNWPHIDHPCGTGDACYAYEYRNYIDTKEGELTGNACPPNLHHIIVEVSSGSYLDWNGYDATPFVAIHTNKPHLRKIKNLGKTCIKKIPVRRGLFAVVGHTNADRTNFVIDGVVPEAKIKHGYQGISGTCMNSIAGVTPKTLSKG